MSHTRNQLWPGVIFTLIASASGYSSAPANAESYLLQNLGRDAVIGAIGQTAPSDNDTLSDIARRFDVGYDEIVKANPNVDRWVPAQGARVVIPSQYILPSAPHEGIVLNLAELRLYYFPTAEGSEGRLVYTFPVSIGRVDWKSPLGATKVISKEENPTWCPTPSIRAEHAAEGDYLPECIRGGIPDNPLGYYALRLAFEHYLIHGTNAQKEFGIGMRVTHGCIRLYPEDIEQLFHLVSPGTPVYIVDQPIKVGWKSGGLYIEVHAPLAEDEAELEEYTHRLDIREAIDLIREVSFPNMTINVSLLKRIIARADGMPALIYQNANALPPSRR